MKNNPAPEKFQVFLNITPKEKSKVCKKYNLCFAFCFFGCTLNSVRKFPSYITFKRSYQNGFAA